MALREPVAILVEEARAVLRPAEAVDPRRIERRFVLRASDGFVENFAPALLARIEREAPGVRLRFVARSEKGNEALREGRVDLDIGVVGRGAGPELRVQTLYRDRWIGVVARDHPLASVPIDPASYAAGRHVLVAREGDSGPVDAALEKLGLARAIVTIVGAFGPALALARTGGMIATVPECHTGRLRDGLFSFALPFAMPGIDIAMAWHPRLQADPAHRWLRECVREACASEVEAVQAGGR
jgi:DNA-binding transcriptional LysR family regulator